MIRWDKEWVEKSGYHINVLKMDASMANYILPALKKELKRATRLYEKYQDIQEGGEATRLQQTLLAKYENKMRTLSTIINVIEPQLNMKGGAR